MSLTIWAVLYLGGDAVIAPTPGSAEDTCPRLRGDWELRLPPKSRGSGGSLSRSGLRLQAYFEEEVWEVT